MGEKYTVWTQTKVTYRLCAKRNGRKVSFIEAEVQEPDDYGSERLKARFPLPELTVRVNGPRVTGLRPVNSASGNARPLTRPMLTSNGNRSPVNSGR